MLSHAGMQILEISLKLAMAIMIIIYTFILAIIKCVIFRWTMFNLISLCFVVKCSISI